MRVEVSEAARTELAEAVDFYGSVGTALAMRFIDAVAAAFDRLARHPQSGAPVAGTNALRRARIGGFPHLVIYRALEAEVIVVGVFHPSRDPGELRSR